MQTRDEERRRFEKFRFNVWGEERVQGGGIHPKT
jgi:hypothetical protein